MPNKERPLGSVGFLLLVALALAAGIREVKFRVYESEVRRREAVRAGLDSMIASVVPMPLGERVGENGYAGVSLLIVMTAEDRFACTPLADVWHRISRIDEGSAVRLVTVAVGPRAVPPLERHLDQWKVTADIVADPDSTLMRALGVSRSPAEILVTNEGRVVLWREALSAKTPLLRPSEVVLEILAAGLHPSADVGGDT